MSESRTGREYGRTSLFILSATIGTVAALGAGCSVIATYGANVHTHAANPNSPTTKQIKADYPGASDIQMDNVAQDGGPNENSFMTWVLPNGEDCKVYTDTPEFRTDTATSFVLGPGQTLRSAAVCLTPSSSPSA